MHDEQGSLELFQILVYPLNGIIDEVYPLVLFVRKWFEDTFIENEDRKNGVITIKCLEQPTIIL